MDKSIIKLAIIILVVSLTLLIASMCIAMKYGGMMINSSINSSDQTNGTGATNSLNQK